MSSSGRRGNRGRGGGHRAARDAAPGSKASSENGVGEDFRIQVEEALLTFRDTDEPQLEFPADLNNVQRKFVHHLCGQLGLDSKSYGKGESRRIIVKRKRSKGTGGAGMLPQIHLHPESEAVIARYLDRFPPTPAETSPTLGSAEEFKMLSTRATHAPQAGIASSAMAPPQPTDAARTSPAAAEALLAPAPEPPAPPMAAKEHLSALARRVSDPRWSSVLQGRASLPAWTARGLFSRALRRSRVILVSGATGCGKSTQVPQFILDDPEIGPRANVIVTQPRRISATSLAERVADERLEPLGNTVGYRVKLDAKRGRNTRLLFCTTGVLLRRIAADPWLRGVTHVVLDEVHERDAATDFLLVLLRDLLLRGRRGLTVVVMSATMQLQLFLEYFARPPRAGEKTAALPLPPAAAAASSDAADADGGEDGAGAAGAAAAAGPLAGLED